MFKLLGAFSRLQREDFATYLGSFSGSVICRNGTMTRMSAVQGRREKMGERVPVMSFALRLPLLLLVMFQRPHRRNLGQSDFQSEWYATEGTFLRCEGGHIEHKLTSPEQALTILGLGSISTFKCVPLWNSVVHIGIDCEMRDISR